MIVGTHGIPKSPLFSDPHAHANATPLKTSSITCCSKHHDYNIPKLEPFSRTKFERGLPDPPLIDKSQNQLADYCTLLEGETSYSCWQAYFELKDLQKEYTKDQVEKLIIEAGGVKSLIGCLHGVTAIHKANKSASSHAPQDHNPRATSPMDSQRRLNNSRKRKILKCPTLLIPGYLGSGAPYLLGTPPLPIE